MKQRRYFYMDSKDFKKLKTKMLELGYSGHASLSKFMMKITNTGFIFFEGDGVFKIELLNKK